MGYLFCGIQLPNYDQNESIDSWWLTIATALQPKCCSTFQFQNIRLPTLRCNRVRDHGIMTHDMLSLVSAQCSAHLLTKPVICSPEHTQITIYPRLIISLSLPLLAQKVIFLFVSSQEFFLKILVWYYILRLMVDRIK